MDPGSSFQRVLLYCWVPSELYTGSLEYENGKLLGQHVVPDHTSSRLWILFWAVFQEKEPGIRCQSEGSETENGWRSGQWLSAYPWHCQNHCGTIDLPSRDLHHLTWYNILHIWKKVNQAVASRKNNNHHQDKIDRFCCASRQYSKKIAGHKVKKMIRQINN